MLQKTHDRRLAATSPMMYTTTPPQALHSHCAYMPYAKQPWKSLYVCQRLITTLLLVPWWILYYCIFPRPRPSWSLRQVINVKFTRRIYKVVEVAGVTWDTRDPTSEPARHSLKETRFQWVKPLDQFLHTGITTCNSERVSPQKVGVFVWPFLEPNTTGLIGIFMHGGGYCQMSAHEKSRTSHIPRRLMQDRLFSQIYSVEYRLLQYAPFPAAIQDAAAVYVHIISKHGPDARIVLIGDSSGGNLALALARWIRDEKKLPSPTGLLLFSPSCDPSHALAHTLSSYIPRPHASTDYLVDTPEPRALLQRTFLGFKYRPIRGDMVFSEAEAEEERRLMEIAHSEYVSPASPVVLERWNRVIPEDEDGPLIPKVETLFGGFPKCLIVAGDAERLEAEILCLEKAMKRDGVDVKVLWIKDAVHDVFIMAPGWWDDKVREDARYTISAWVISCHTGP